MRCFADCEPTPYNPKQVNCRFLDTQNSLSCVSGIEINSLSARTTSLTCRSADKRERSSIRPRTSFPHTQRPTSRPPFASIRPTQVI